MGSSYYTRPDLSDESAALSSDQTNTSIGMFPWSAGGFGNGDTTAPINYGQRESFPPIMSVTTLADYRAGLFRIAELHLRDL